MAERKPSHHGGLSLTGFQKAQNEGVLAMEQNPSSIATIFQTSRSMFEGMLHVQDRLDQTQKAFAQFRVETMLRQMVLRMLGYRLIGESLPVIHEVMTDHPTPTPLLEPRFDSTFTGQYRRRHTGSEAHLTNRAQEYIHRITIATFDTFSSDEMDEVSRAFKEITHSRKEAIDNHLASHPFFEKHPEAISVDPYTLDIPKNLFRFLMMRRDSDDVKTSFMGATGATAEFVSRTLSDLHTALRVAGCSEDELWELSYANIGKLQAPALLSFWPGHRIAASPRETAADGIFIVEKDTLGNYLVKFKDEALQKVYEQGNIHECQGAFQISFQNNDELSAMQRNIVAKSGAYTPDIDIAQQVSSTHMLTLLIVAIAQRDQYELGYFLSK